MGHRARARGTVEGPSPSIATSRSRRKASELAHSVDGYLTARENVLVLRASGQMGSHANERFKVHALAPEAGTAPVSSAKSALGG